MNKIKKIITLTSFLLSGQVFASDLLTVYKQALENDPTYQMARAQWLSDKENIAINRGTLLPQFDASANYGRYMDDLKGNDRNYYSQIDYTLALSQPIFNYSSWSKLQQAKAGVKSSAATYSNAAQDLIYRTSNAYLTILKNNDILRFTTAQKNADASLLEQTKQRFKVGLATITDVQNAQATYDNDVSLEITAKNNLDVAKEQLREITGVYNKSFALLVKNLPLVTPNPNSVEKWVAAAEKQNYSLIAAEYNLEAARENIKVQAGNGMPVVNATGSYGSSDVTNGAKSANMTEGNTGMVGLNLTLPVFRGGTTLAQIRQAQYGYQNASANLEYTHRAVVSQTSQAYLNVISGISSVKANKQAVISNQSALDSTKASYSVGVKTIVDVLVAESSLYQAQQNYAESQYSYLIQTLALKEQVGTLGFDDLKQINSWLQPETAEKPMVIKAGHKTKTNTVSALNPASTKSATQNSNSATTTTVQKNSMPTANPEKTKEQPVVNPTTVAAQSNSQGHKVENSSRTLTAAEQKIFRIDPHHYTVQIFAAHEPSELMDFVNKNNIKETIYTFQVKNGDEIWYDLVVGDFQSRFEAQALADKLSASIQGLQPWVRTYSNVQEAIKHS
jgi:outer membrane protein